MVAEFPKENSKFFLPGPEGNLEVMTTRPSKLSKPITGVICHPHPLYGGTMDNKVVTVVAKTFDQLGLKTVRFNFRGVGKSEGHYANGVGETGDLKAILTWVRKTCPDDAIWLAGFSFGSYVAAQVANEDHGVARLITIAPTVDNCDYQALTNIACPWLIIVGEEDELVPLADIQAFVKTPPVPVQFFSIPGASHFFHGKLIELRERLLFAGNANENDSQLP